MTQAPLPTWAQVRRALRGPTLPDTELIAPWRRSGDVAGLLSRSSWSLALIAEWRRRLAPERPVTFWLPAFFCNSALVVLRRTGARLVFYPVNDALEPDTAAFPALAADAPPDIVMAVHYFGRPSPTAAMHDFCTRHKAWLVEDAAHVLNPVAGVGVHGDFVVYSPHKLLPIPDGAVLVARPGGSSRLGAGLAAFGDPATWPAQLQNLERDMGGAVKSVTSRVTTWLVKRAAQKLGVRRAAEALPFGEPMASDDRIDLPAPACSVMSRRLLGAHLKDLGARRRERHQLLWDAVLTGDGAEQERDVAPAERPRHRSWTPYLSAYTAAPAEHVYDAWSRRGCPVTTWPDLAPEVKADTEKHAHAWRLRHSRIYLPVHASLSPFAIARRRVSGALPATTKAVSMQWDSASPEQWNRWLAEAGRSNLLQDWAYGVAKAEETGWKVRRVAFFGGASTPVAIAQLFERRIARLATLRRMNRAPMFIGAATDDERSAVWRATAGLGALLKRQVLAVAPEALLTGSSLLAWLDLGFRPSARAAAWQSVWLSLEPGTDVLRRSLHKEWRNALSASERTGLTAEVTTSDDAFAWLMERYRELMGEKHFAGSSIELLSSLRRHAGPGHVFVVRALKDGAAIAGILIGRHGDAATYLVGWNGPYGRPLKANHFLLWHAVGHLRETGVRWFDLGGLSDEDTPGITAFKLGMGGERYELAGEFLKW